MLLPRRNLASEAAGSYRSVQLSRSVVRQLPGSTGTAKAHKNGNKVNIGLPDFSPGSNLGQRVRRGTSSTLRGAKVRSASGTTRPANPPADALAHKLCCHTLGLSALAFEGSRGERGEGRGERG